MQPKRSGVSTPKPKPFSASTVRPGVTRLRPSVQKVGSSTARHAQGAQKLKGTPSSVQQSDSRRSSVQLVDDDLGSKNQRAPLPQKRRRTMHAAAVPATDPDWVSRKKAQREEDRSSDDRSIEDDRNDPDRAIKRLSAGRDRSWAEAGRLSEKSGLPITKVRHIRKHFGAMSDKIIDLLTADDNDAAETLVYQTILMSIIGAMPSVEAAMHKSKGTRNIHQYNQMVSQLRETMMDIQSRRDRGSVGQIVVDKHIRPAMLNSAQQMMITLTQLLGLFPFPSQEDRTRFSHEVVFPLQKELGKFLHEQLIKLTQDVAQELS